MPKTSIKIILFFEQDNETFHYVMKREYYKYTTYTYKYATFTSE